MTKTTPILADRLHGSVAFAGHLGLGAFTYLLLLMLANRDAPVNSGTSSSRPASVQPIDIPLSEVSIFGLYIAAGLFIFFGRWWGFAIAIGLMGYALVDASGPWILVTTGLILYSALRLTGAIGSVPK